MVRSMAIRCNTNVDSESHCLLPRTNQRKVCFIASPEFISSSQGESQHAARIAALLRGEGWPVGKRHIQRL